MNIMFLTRALDIGGAQRQLVLLASELKKKGHNVNVMVFYGGEILQKDLERSQIPVISLNKRGRWDIIPFMIRLIRIIRKNKPDILYSFLPVSNTLSVFMRLFHLNLKIVWGIRSSNMDLKHYDWLSVLFNWFERILSRFAHHLVYNSYAGHKYAISTGLHNTSYSVIQNGIDTNKYSFDYNNRQMTRREYGLIDDEIVIGLVARLDPMKDHATFFDACLLMLNSSFKLRFICVGSGTDSYTSKLKNLETAKKLGKNLIWLGEVHDMHSIYPLFDLLCSSSAYGEGFSNVIGEAMACGISCVVTDVGDSALIVGEMGRVVPVEDPVALANACLSVLGNKPRPEKIRARVVNHFSVESIVNKTESALKSLFPDNHKKLINSSPYD